MSRAARPPRSLQAKALQLLSQREQSQVELRRKLVAHARASDRAEAAARALLDPGPVGAAADVAGSNTSADEGGSSIEARVDTVLAWLDTHRFASDERFAESRVHARQGRFGNLRIRQELATHAITLSVPAARALAESELPRAIDVCSRKFREPASNTVESARQARFLIARGFSPDVVRLALRERARDARAGTTEAIADDLDEG